MTKTRNKEEGERKKSILLLGTTALLVPYFPLLFLVGCKPKQEQAATKEVKSLEAKAEQVATAAKEKIETLEQRFVRERAEYREMFHNQHLKLEARVNELKRRAELDAKKRPELEWVIHTLEQRSQALRERLQRLKSASAENWDEAKAPWQKKQGYEDYEDEILKETSM